MDICQKNELGKRCVFPQPPSLGNTRTRIVHQWLGSFAVGPHLVGDFPVTLLHGPRRRLSFLFRRSDRGVTRRVKIAALREEFSTRPVIAAQTPRFGRLVGAGAEPEDEDEAEWEPDVVPRVDGARRRQNTARSVHSDCDLREQVGHPSLRKRPQNAAPTRGGSKTVGTFTNGAGVQTGGKEKGTEVPRKSDHRGGRDGRGTRPRGWDQSRRRDAQPCSGGKAGGEECCGSAKRCGMRKTEQETFLDVRYSELKRELKEIKRARQQLEVAGAEDREDVATGDTLYGAAFVKPPVPGAVKRQKRRRSGSRSSSVFRGARGKGHDPVASKLAIWAESNPGILRDTQHSADGRPTQSRRSSTGLEASGLPSGGHLPPAPNIATPCTMPSQEKSRARDPLRDHLLAAGQFGRAADVATQHYKATEMAMAGRKRGVSSGAFCPKQRVS